MLIEAVNRIRISPAENIRYNFDCKNGANAVPILAERPKAAPVLPNTLRPFGASAVLSFTGNPDKNKKQVVSIAAEYGQLLKDVYEAGGLGVVTNEAAQAMYKKGVDVRTIVPYYCADNKNGKIKVRVQQPDNTYYFKEVEVDYKLQSNEVFVAHEKPIPGKESQTGYKIIDKTGIRGTIKSINADLTGTKELSYEMFKFRDTGENNPAVYCIHLPLTAKFAKCYNPNPVTSKVSKQLSFVDADYSDFDKAVVDALPKLNEKKFGNFNPASIWLHDRQTFPFLVEAAQKSSQGDEYYKGIKTHLTYHNVGRNYQGHYKYAIDFFRLVGSGEDLEALKAHPEYEFVKEMAKKISIPLAKDKRFATERILNKEEMKKLDAIFAPLIGEFRDETGEYNLAKVAPNAVKLNPENVTAGTVSYYYGEEMRNLKTVDCAKGLTKAFKKMPKNDVLNGSAPANLYLNEIGNFGKGNFNNPEIKNGFTPLNFKYDAEHILQNPDEIYEAKLSNKKWMIDSIAKAASKGKKDLHDLFFEATDTDSTVLGELSQYKEGDQLIINWGRPVPQKGFATALESYLQFFKDENIDENLKLKTKVLLSGGPWNKWEQDWKDIKRLMGEIAELDGGKYAKNVCYLNGHFTNRMVACADFAHITSRFEPCGITPFEAFAAGTLVISNRTGGSPDFITSYNGENAGSATGFLTVNPYFADHETLGVSKQTRGKTLDNVRRIKSGAENAACLKAAMEIATKKADIYKKMLKNAASVETDWDNNHKLNGGISSIDKYLNIWDIYSLKANNSKPLKPLKGQLGN